MPAASIRPRLAANPSLRVPDHRPSAGGRMLRARSPLQSATRRRRPGPTRLRSATAQTPRAQTRLPSAKGPAPPALPIRWRWAPVRSTLQPIR
jgi:hypothetical protein